MSFLDDFTSRVLPNIKAKVKYEITPSARDNYEVSYESGDILIKANCIISATHGLYSYLKKYCGVNLSWNGNRKISIDRFTPFSGVFGGEIDQKYRVYMNYCTLNYSMSWWSFERWEQELDFMALNGINMPLMVIGTEAVWFETLLEFGYTREEALKTISGPAFWAWQLMTNIEGYMPPTEEKYVYDRLELGKKILGRAVEFGMYPIQQGFSGHVPMSMKTKFNRAKIGTKPKWCDFPATAQLDPLDPLFDKFGKAYLAKQGELLGNHHYYATDPFHEGQPPKNTIFYLRKVGKTIDKMFTEFDPQAVWVMQSWSLRKDIVRAIDKRHLLILDINSQKYKTTKNFWGYDYVLGYLHNFGGKNALQGRIEAFSENLFEKQKPTHDNVVGTGLFMEGIENNPYIYDALFEMLTAKSDLDIPRFNHDYIVRRYGKYSEKLDNVYDTLIKTCYNSNGTKENEVGSMLCARPEYAPTKASPCDNLDPNYDKPTFAGAVLEFASVSQEFATSDGYQYDLLDMTRQAISDVFYTNQLEYAKVAKDMDIAKAKEISDKQLELLVDLDELLSTRSETCLSRWIQDAHNLATCDSLKEYYDKNARTQITLWGDTDGACALHDYAWKEWSGLIKEYYLPRWKMFYDESLEMMKKGKLINMPLSRMYFGRPPIRGNEFYNRMMDSELKWCNTYKEYEYPVDKDTIAISLKMIDKYLK